MAIQDLTSSSHVKHDVFLSFRGGTRHAFTDHLYRKLCDNGIDSFRDKENLRVGDEIRPSLFGSIEKSRMAIAVLCKDYASSPWCLDELVRIIHCHEKKGMQVLAIIYKVEPSDVWEVKNSYEAAMGKLEKSKRYDEETLEAWRTALTKVQNLERVHCAVDTYEPEFIKKIVRDTAAKLPPVPSQIKRVVGLDSRYEQAKPLINIESDQNVSMLEIYGPGGIGKTTFARFMYDKIKHLFEARCFLENVREKSTESAKGLEHLQKTLLSSMGEDTETRLGSTFKGGYEIKRRLSRKRVLIVLDDVSSVKQLESLAGGRDWFGPGSRIVITTRDTTVLDKHNAMNGVVIEKYKMEELNNNDSLELFSWYAFQNREPPNEFANVSNTAISFAKGFPLAIKVIASNLKSIEMEEEWQSELEKYKDVPDDEILGVLEISYKSLFDLDQKTFLDIACFFKGERWEYVRRVLKACDFYPILRVFVSKSLINVNENGCLEMHDLIQDMGKEIVRKESPELGGRSRLWSHDEILQVLQNDSGSSSIEGIMLHPPQHKELKHWTNTAFEKMKNLRILIVRNTIFSRRPSSLPNSLRLLDWKGYPSESFPQDFYPHRIVDFKLPHSHLTLERSFQKFEDLTFINLSQCQSITQVPNLSEAKNLRVLTLDRCHKLLKFDESVGSMPNLVYLSATECSKLEIFVQRMDFPSLEVLSFNFCKRLKQFPEVVKKMDKPLKIYLMNTAIKEFPETIGNLTGLEHIDISFCTRLKNLPSSFFLLPKLVTLTIEGCSQLGESFKRFIQRNSTENGFPNLRTLYFSEADLSSEVLDPILQNFPKLEELIVSHNGFTSLPKSIIGSSNIKSLDVSYCMNLRYIPELPSSVQKVDARYCQSLTSEASTMLWSKVSQDTKRLQVVMPRTKIPNWFNFVRNEDIPLFWARRKFPIVAIAFVFGEANEVVEIDTDTPEFLRVGSPKSHIVGLNLFIDSKEILCQDYCYFSVGEDHVLLCDLRALFNDQEWQGLDECLGEDWAPIQVQCESQLKLIQWGLYVYKQETNMDDIFKLPSSNSSEGYVPSSHLVPKRTPQHAQQRIRHVTENFNPREIFGQFSPLVELDENPFFSKALVRSWRNAKAGIRGEASASSYGASLKQEHEESPWDVVRVVDLIKENVPKHIVDSYSDDIDSAYKVLEEVMRARLEFMKENGQETLDIDMPIILEENDSDEGPCRRYWGRLEIKHGDPMFKAVMRRTTQLTWRVWNHDRGSKQWMHIVLLKCQRPLIEELASSSSHGEPLEEEYYDPVLEELMSMIEQDAMNLNKSHGKLKASIVFTDDLISDKYLLESMFLRGPENLGKKGMSGWAALELGLLGMFGSGMLGPETLGSSLVKTPYGSLRVDNDARRISQNQHNLMIEHNAQSSTPKQLKLMAEHNAQSSTQQQKPPDAKRSAQKQIKLMTEHDAQRMRQEQDQLAAEHNSQSSNTQNQKQHESRVEHDAKRGALKPIKLMTKQDAQRAKLKQQKLNAEQTAQSSTQSQDQPQLKVEHDSKMQDKLWVENNAHSTQTQVQHELRVERDAQPTVQSQQHDELMVENNAQNNNHQKHMEDRLGWTKILRCILCCD